MKGKLVVQRLEDLDAAFLLGEQGIANASLV